MSDFKQAIKHIGDNDFPKYLKMALEHMDTERLPLQAGLANSSYVSASPVTAVILGFDMENNFIRARAGLFYTGIIAGCNCADDPSPVDEVNEYCEIELLIDRQSACAEIKLL